MNPMDDGPEAPGGYVSTHLANVQDGLGYTRAGYAAKTWLTYEGRMPADRATPLLEIGPGGGELVELLVRTEGYRSVTVVDREPEATQVAAALGADAVLSDDLAGYLAGVEGRFGAILMFHVLEHLTKVEVIPVLTACRRALSPGGVLLLEVPNMGDPFNGLHTRYADFTHEVGFTEESLEYVLGLAGFRRTEFLEPVGATGRFSRPAQRLARRVLHLGLRLISLPNGRQMSRRIDPVLAVCAQA
jgi:SAM-dependent methyltransferase